MTHFTDADGAPRSTGFGRDASTIAYSVNTSVRAIQSPSRIWMARVVPAAFPEGLYLSTLIAEVE